MKKKKRISFLKIIMIQKFILGEYKSKNFLITQTKLTLNKDLNFFLFKKNFFLYKSVQKNQPSNKFNLNSNLGYLGNNLFFGNLLDSLLKRLKHNKSISQSYGRKYIFYRIKKSFRSINMESRRSLFKLLNLKLNKTNQTIFFEKTKNFEKEKMFSSFFFVNSNKNVLNLFKIQKSMYGLYNKLEFFNKKNRIMSITISKPLQLFILSNETSLKKTKQLTKLSHNAIFGIEREKKLSLDLKNQEKDLKMGVPINPQHYIDVFKKKKINKTKEYFKVDSRSQYDSNSILDEIKMEVAENDNNKYIKHTAINLQNDLRAMRDHSKEGLASNKEFGIKLTSSIESPELDMAFSKETTSTEHIEASANIFFDIEDVKNEYSVETYDHGTNEEDEHLEDNVLGRRLFFKKKNFFNKKLTKSIKKFKQTPGTYKNKMEYKIDGATADIIDARQLVAFDLLKKKKFINQNDLKKFNLYNYRSYN